MVVVGGDRGDGQFIKIIEYVFNYTKGIATTRSHFAFPVDKPSWKEINYYHLRNN